MEASCLTTHWANAQHVRNIRKKGILTISLLAQEWPKRNLSLQYLKKDDEKVMNKWKVDENKGMKHENMNLGILLVLAPNHWSQNYEKYMKYSEENWSFHLGSEMVICLHPNISMHILYIFLYTFPMVLARRICLTIKSFLNCR